MTRTKKYLVAIILLSMVISLSYSFYFQNKPVVDAKKYDEVGWNIAQGLGYRINSDASFTRDYAIFMVGPGYQFFLSGVYKVFGHNLGVVWFLQSLMLAFSGLLAFLTSKELFKNKWHPTIGLVAAGLVALSPDLIMSSSMILTDILGIFLMMFSIWAFLRFYNRGGILILVLSSAALAGAIMTRSALILLLPLLMIWLWQKKKLMYALLATFIVVSLFAPWTIRNWKTFGMFMPFNAAGYMDFWWGNRVGATGELDDAPEITKYINEHDVKSASEYSILKGREFIFTQPIKFAGLVIKRASIYFSFIRPTGWWPFPGPRGYNFNWIRFVDLSLSVLYSVIIFTLGIAGIWKTLKDRATLDEKSLWLFVIATALMPLSILWLFVESRYRFPIYPLLAIFAGYFFYSMRAEESCWWKNKILWTVLIILSLNSAYDILTNVSRILERLS